MYEWHTFTKISVVHSLKQLQNNGSKQQSAVKYQVIKEYAHWRQYNGIVAACLYDSRQRLVLENRKKSDWISVYIEQQQLQLFLFFLFLAIYLNIKNKSSLYIYFEIVSNGSNATFLPFLKKKEDDVGEWLVEL